MSEEKIAKKNNLINKFLLIIGKETSRFGNILFDYANSILIVNMFKTNALFLAIYQSSETIISIFFNLLGGVFADQGKKKRIIVFTDILSAIICIFVALFVKSQIVLIAIIIANILLAILHSFNSPVYSSIIRDTIEKKEVPKFNSVQNGVSEIVRVGGTAIAAVMISIVGAQGALIIDAVTFLLSAITESRLKLWIKNDYNSPKKHSNVLDNLRDGFRYLYSEKGILRIIFIAAFVNFFLSGYTLLIPYTNNFYDGKFTDFYGKVLAIEAAGGVIGSLLNSKVKFKNELTVLAVTLQLTGISISLTSILGESKYSLVCLIPHFFAATIVAVYNIRFISYIQINIDAAYLGRVFSIINVASLVFVPAGAFVFAKVCDVTNLYGYLFSGIGIFVFGLVSLFLGRTDHKGLSSEIGKK